MADSAIKSLHLPDQIRLETRYCAYPAPCLIDAYHTASAISNLIANSVDALMLCDREDKLITVSIDASREWINLTVSDNGGGIHKRQIKQVIMPFFSTKPTAENWGIGLPYVFRVVTA